VAYFIRTTLAAVAERGAPMHKTGIVTSALVIAGLTAAGCASQGTAHKVSSPVAGNNTIVKKPRAQAPAQPLTGTVGTAFEVSGTDENGNITHYKVQIVKWIPVAAPDNSFDAAPKGHFLAAAEFKITGVSGQSQNDADTTTQMISTTGHLAEDNIGGIKDGTDFNGGDFSVGPGQVEVGYVSFIVPISQKINTIQWSDDGFTGGPVVTWKVTP
jgi:hypothetical protein